MSAARSIFASRPKQNSTLPIPGQRDSMFSNIPNEITLQILGKLDLEDILMFRLVCRPLCSLLDNDSEIQYKIDLARAGMRDVSYSKLPVVERRALLRLHQEAWRQLQPTSISTWSFPKYSTKLTLRGGILAHSYCKDTSFSLQFLSLSPNTHRSEATAWELKDSAITKSQYAFDPQQDVLAFIEPLLHAPNRMRIHIRSLRRGTIHPLAPSPIIDHIFPPLATGFEVLDIFSDHLLITGIELAQFSRSFILIVTNWKTGDILLNLHGFRKLSCAFLSERYILLNALDDRGEASCLTVADYRRNAPEPMHHTCADYVCKFSYPPLRRGVRTIKHEISRPGAQTNMIDTLQTEAPFSTSRDGCFVKVDVNFTIPDKGNSSKSLYLVHLIPQSVLLRLAEAASGRLISYEWKIWSLSTFCFAHPHAYSYSLFGTKLVRYTPGDRPTVLCILSLNQREIKYRQDKGTLNRNTCGSEAISRNAEKITSYIFDTPVINRLQCHLEQHVVPWLAEHMQDETRGLEEVFIYENTLAIVMSGWMNTTCIVARF